MSNNQNNDVSQKIILENKRYKKNFRISMFFTIVFCLSIIAMFTISYVSGQSSRMANYENEIIQKYESWESDLSRREQELREKINNANDED